MKKIGIIGGMSWESTIEYYRIINEEVQKRFGGLKSAEILIESYDFSQIAELQRQNDWAELERILADSAQRLEDAGAEMVLIATNTMHKVAPYVLSKVHIPLLHIADAAAEEMKKLNITKAALLGTKFTMTEDFYRGILSKKHNIETIIPDEKAQNTVHSIIFDELCAGRIIEDSRRKLSEIIETLKAQGAQAVILGCTELPLVIKTASLPIIDTTELHALSAVNYALKEEKIPAAIRN